MHQPPALLSPRHEASVTEEGNFSFHLVLVHLNNHLGLLATVLGSLG